MTQRRRLTVIMRWSGRGSKAGTCPELYEFLECAVCTNPEYGEGKNNKEFV